MGIKCTPDIAQNAMEKVLRGIADIKVCIDDIAAYALNKFGFQHY